MPNGAKDQQPWEALENYVASLYRALGWTVYQDELLQGNQLDLIAEKAVAGVGTLRIFVEVKLRADSVKLDEVNQFLVRAQQLINRGEVAKAVMVTGSHFTKLGKQAAQGDKRIELCEVRTLARNLFASDARLLTSVDDYERTAISNHYIDLRSHQLDVVGVTDPPPIFMTAGVLASDLRSRSYCSYILVADYGAGKTTTLERIKYLSTKSFLAGDGMRIPILFNLKDYRSHASFEIFVTATIQRELGIDISFEDFRWLQNRGHFVMLLDGFDEISIRSNENERADLLVELGPLLFGTSPSVLSVRPSYFATRAEYLKAFNVARQARMRPLPSPVPTPDQADSETESLRLSPKARTLAQTLMHKYEPDYLRQLIEPSYSVYALQPLSPLDITNYLKGFNGECKKRGLGSWRSLAKFIESAYDLSDLVTRPIILEMIVATILEGEIDPDSLGRTITPKDLYEAYTWLKADIEAKKSPERRRGLSRRTRQRFAEECARFLFVQDAPQVPRESLRQIATDASFAIQPELSTEWDEEAVLTDLRTCSFLTTEGDGALRFIHKSFYEFFLARQIVDRVMESDDWSLMDIRLPREIPYFLGGYLTEETVWNAFAKRLTDRLSIQPTSGDVTADGRSAEIDNLCRSFLHSGRLVEGLRWAGVAADGMTFGRLVLNDCRMQGILTGLDGQELICRASTFDLDFDIKCSDVALVGCEGILQLRGRSQQLQISNHSRLEIDFSEFSVRSFPVKASRVLLTGGDRGGGARGNHLICHGSSVSTQFGASFGKIETHRSKLTISENLAESASIIEMYKSVGFFSDLVASKIEAVDSIILWDRSKRSARSANILLEGSILICSDLSGLVLSGEGVVIGTGEFELGNEKGALRSNLETHLADSIVSLVDDMSKQETLQGLAQLQHLGRIGEDRYLTLITDRQAMLARLP